MGVEPPPGVGASAGADLHAHHRVCSCHLACQRAGCRLACSRPWLWPTHQRHLLESWPLLWKGLCPPARRDALLSSRQDAASDRAAHRARWLSAGALRRQDPRLSPVPASAEQCQWHGHQTTKPRRVSLLLHPLSLGSAPLLWRDWSRRAHRRACMQLLRRQRADVTLEQALPPHPDASPPILSRAQRAHYRLSEAERLARNARAPTASRPTITLFGVPDAFAAFLGLPTQQ